jgi:deoxyadenosine/deoxycytidine kinase
MRNVEFYNFKTLNFHDGTVAEKRLKYFLDLRNVVTEELPYDDTLEPKHVGVVT